MSDRHNWQRRCMRCSSSAHRLQKRECPHGTSASGDLGSEQTYFANCTLCSRYWRRDNIRYGADEDDNDVEVVAASASSTSFQFHHRHCCLRPAVVRSVGCLPCGWLQTKIRTDCTRNFRKAAFSFSDWWKLVKIGSYNVDMNCQQICKILRKKT